METDRFEYTKLKLADGASQREIARDLGVHHSTVAYWINNNFSSGTRTRRSGIAGIEKWCGINAHHYSYILGSYLGDGYINRSGRTCLLRIFNDSVYPEIISDQIRSLQVLFPHNKVYTVPRSTSRCIAVCLYNNQLPKLFPQHGVGRKHNRDIILQEWQLDIVSRTPECFIKGLIDSDGSHYMISSTGKYRYQFTNKSVDIANMYMKVMSELGISARPTRRTDGVIVIRTNAAKCVAKFDRLYEIAEDMIRR